MSPTETTLDRFLDGRLLVEQPARGRHRAGLDAVLDACARFTPEAVADATGLAPDTVRRAARELAATVVEGLRAQVA